MDMDLEQHTEENCHSKILENTTILITSIRNVVYCLDNFIESVS